MAAGVAALLLRTKPWIATVAAGIALATTNTPIGTAFAIVALSAAAVETATKPQRRFVTVESLVVAFALPQALFHLGDRGGARTSTFIAVGVVLAIAASVARRVRLSRRAGLVILGVIAAAAPLSAVFWRHERSLIATANASVATGIDAARSGDTAAATAELDRAQRAFRSISSDLHAWWMQPARIVPGLGQQLVAARSLVDAGVSLSSTAVDLATKVDPSRVKIENGRIDLAALAGLAEPLDAAIASLDRARDRTTSSRSIWLAPPLRNVFDDFDARTARASEDARRARAAVGVAPDMLGANGPRRYFLALQTTAEMRGTGGLVGNYGVLTATDGAIALSKFGRIEELNPERRRAPKLRVEGPEDYVARYRDSFTLGEHWQNVTASPDFPSVGEVITNLAPQSGLGALDGAIAIDPIALAALLRVTGPVEVPEWPEPLTADNAAEILLYRQYVQFGDEANEERVVFLASVSHAVFSRLTSGALSGVTTLIDALGPAVRQKRLVMYSAKPANQDVLVAAGISGALAPVTSDFLGVVTQDATPSKLDWFLRRETTYSAEVDPASGAVDATATVTLRNTAPSTGLPVLAYGSSHWGLRLAESRMYVSVYSPLVLGDASVDGRPITMESATERGRFVYSTFVIIPPGGTARVRLKLAGNVKTTNGYSILFSAQPGAVDARVKVELTEKGARKPALSERFDLESDTTRTLD